MKRAKKNMDKATNSTVYKRARKEHVCNETGKCSFCPMHGGENTARKGKHGSKKPKYKDKR